MMNYILQWLSQILYPKGRAFRMPEPTDAFGSMIAEDGDIFVLEDDDTTTFTVEDPGGKKGIFFRFHRAINKSIERLKSASQNTLDALMPDNPNFTIQDARAWYRRLGLYDSGSVSLDDMKKAIAQKQSFPTTPLDKRSPDFLQTQLQAAGFNVFVYRNRFSDGSGGFVALSPGQVLGVNNKRAISGFFQSGQNQFGELGGPGASKIVTYIEEDKDIGFDIGGSYRRTFFIAGNPINTFATVPLGRKDEFRQLILKYKSAHAVGFLFVQYT